jgi:hypothetical protein
MVITVLRTPSVLLVNDALDEREMYARRLSAAGYRAIGAEDSIDCLLDRSYRFARRRCN